MKKKIIELIEFYFMFYGVYKINLENYNNLNFDLHHNFNFKILKIEDLKYFEALELKDSYLDIIKSRLNNENEFICFALIDSLTNKLAYYSWINQSKSYWVKEMNKTFNFKETRSCLFEDDNTMIEYRSLGLHSFAMSKRIQYCLNNSIKTIYILIHLRNKPALKVVHKFKFKRSNFFPIYIRKEAVIYTLKKIKF